MRDGGSRFLGNVDTYLPNYTQTHHKRTNVHVAELQHILNPITNVERYDNKNDTFAHTN
jgi:hypothetical protein